MPRMNSITERWVKTLHAELLDRTLIWNQTHLRHALREYERHYNEHPGSAKFCSPGRFEPRMVDERSTDGRRALPP